MTGIGTALKLNPGKHALLQQSNHTDIFIQQQWFRIAEKTVLTLKLKLLLLEERIKTMK